MPRVACDSDRQRPVGTATELTVDSPIGLQRHNVLRRVEAPSRSYGRHQIRVAGHQDCGVAHVFADEFKEPGADSDVRLLLLPSDEPAAAQGTRLILGLEVAEMELHAGRFEGPEVRHLTRDRAGTSWLAMVSNGREV